MKLPHTLRSKCKICFLGFYMKRYNLYLIGSILIIIAYVFISSSSFPKLPMDQGYGAAFFPRLISIILLVLVCILFLQNLKIEKAVIDFKFSTIKIPVLLMVMTVINLAIINIFGFIISDILIVTTSMIFLKINWKLALIVSALSVLLTFVLFHFVFDVSFPVGILFSRG